MGDDAGAATGEDAGDATGEDAGAATGEDVGAATGADTGAETGEEPGAGVETGALAVGAGMGLFKMDIVALQNDARNVVCELVGVSPGFEPVISISPFDPAKLLKFVWRTCGS